MIGHFLEIYRLKIDADIAKLNQNSQELLQFQKKTFQNLENVFHKLL